MNSKQKTIALQVAAGALEIIRALTASAIVESAPKPPKRGPSQARTVRESRTLQMQRSA